MLGETILKCEALYSDMFYSAVSAIGMDLAHDEFEAQKAFNHQLCDSIFLWTTTFPQ